MKTLFIRLALVVLTLVLFNSINGQQILPLEPYSATHFSTSLSDIPEFKFSSPKMDEILEEDRVREENGQLELFSRYLETDINITRDAIKNENPDGSTVYYLKVSSENAKGLNVLYDSFQLNEGALLHLYTPDRKETLGGYSHLNNSSSGAFATGNLTGNTFIIELYEPAGNTNHSVVSINRLGYVYRSSNITAAGGGSQACEVNIACSEGDNWEDEEKGVVRILVVSSEGQGWCSGSLINNTAQDCAPLILTAWHCGLDSSPAQFNQFIYYFHYQANTCGSNNPFGFESITGSTRLAYSNDGGGPNGSDFLLTRLNSDIPETIDVYYNGWNANNTSSSSGVSIHHPAGDIKKISTYSTSLISSSWQFASNSHWRATWQQTANGHGVTEGGSSGSPIFNASGLIIGQLTGGSSFCDAPNDPDLYGKMSYNWTSNGNQNFEQLKNFLDPTNSGDLVLDGSFEPCANGPLMGCTDLNALNYDPIAEEDDGSCEYPCTENSITIDLSLDCYGVETSWQISDSGGNIIHQIEAGTYSGTDQSPETNGTSDQVTLCLSEGCYDISISDTYGDGLSGSQYNGCNTDGNMVITNEDNEILYALGAPDFGFETSSEFCIIDPSDQDDDGFTTENGDCDDQNDEVYPGAPELCDGVDNNCDGNTDEGFVISAWYADTDDDGYGDVNNEVISCSAPDGYVSNNTDCDDTSNQINPGMSEACNGIDDNCNTQIDEGLPILTYFLDADNDGYGNPDQSVQGCSAPAGYVSNNSDCDDASDLIHPGMSEICNGIDENCNDQIDENLIIQTFYLDADDDGYGNPDIFIEDCDLPNDSYVLNSNDCDDSDDTINPAATEIMDDGIDQDCNGEDLVTDISEHSVSLPSLFPNPVSDKLIIESSENISSIQILDVTGKLVYSYSPSNAHIININSASFSSGTYFIGYEIEGVFYHDKFIKE